VFSLFFHTKVMKLQYDTTTIAVIIEKNDLKERIWKTIGC